MSISTMFEHYEVNAYYQLNGVEGYLCYLALCWQLEKDVIEELRTRVNDRAVLTHTEQVELVW